MPDAELSRQSGVGRDLPREQDSGLDGVVARAQSRARIARGKVGAKLKCKVALPGGEESELESRLKIARSGLGVERVGNDFCRERADARLRLDGAGGGVCEQREPAGKSVLEVHVSFLEAQLGNDHGFKGGRVRAG